MELTINEEQAKGLLKEVLIELMEEKRELFFEVMLEATEETGLANAIREGRQNEFVSEEQIQPSIGTFHSVTPSDLQAARKASP